MSATWNIKERYAYLEQVAEDQSANEEEAANFLNQGGGERSAPGAGHDADMEEHLRQLMDQEGALGQLGLKHQVGRTKNQKGIPWGRYFFWSTSNLK